MTMPTHLQTASPERPMKTGKSEPFFILGLPNTATSTLVGIVNSHPEILVCYETWSLPPRLTNYSSKLCAAFPEVRRMFSGSLNLPDSYAAMGGVLAAQGHSYRYIGDKVVSFTFDEMTSLAETRAVYITRPLTEWLIKREVRRAYGTDLDAVTPALHYLRCLAFANTRPRWLRVSMQNLMSNPRGFISKLAAALDLLPGDFDHSWWNSLQNYKDPVKNSMKWADAHPSSLMPPQHIPDIKYRLTSHPFWSDVADTAEDLLNRMEGGISDNEAAELEMKFQAIADRYPSIPLQALYSEFSEKRHTPYVQPKSLKHRILDRVSGWPLNKILRRPA